MSPTAGHEFAPRPWALATFFVATALAATVLAILLGLSTIVVVAAPAVGTWAFSRSARVTIEPDGVRLGSSACGWADIELRQLRWGTALRSRADVPRRSRLMVYLPMYLVNWETHPIRADLRRWAPHLSIPR